MLLHIETTAADSVAYLYLSSLLVGVLGSTISIFKLCYFTVHFTALLQNNLPRVYQVLLFPLCIYDENCV